MEEESPQDSMCRLCLKTSSIMEDLFTSKLKYNVIIEELTGLKLKLNTELPSMVCGGCIKTINILIEFKKNCIKSQKILEAQNNTMKVEATSNTEEEANDDSDDGTLFLDVKVENRSESEDNTLDKSLSEKNKRTINRNIGRNSRKLETNDKIKNEPGKSKSLKTETQKTTATTNTPGTTTAVSSKEKQCYICGKMIHKMGIEFHLNIHLGRRPFKCKVESCGKAYPSPRELRQHNTFNHSKLEPHECETCGRRYKTRPQLKAHIMTHTNPKIPCNLCGKLFRNRELLDKHILGHTGEHPFYCDDCFKGFKDQWSLKVHLRKAHGKEEPIICSLCGMPFGNNSDLKRHMKRIHPECDESFFQNLSNSQSLIS